MEPTAATTESARLALLRLLQLASPTLPVGAYSYSQGLEAAVDAGLIVDARSAQRWIEDLLDHSLAVLEGPLVLRLCRAWVAHDERGAAVWNRLFIASRESAELLAETLQMGYSLRLLLERLVDARALDSFDQVAWPTAFACAAAAWGITPEDALLGYLWAWIENQVLTAVKTVPLGQTDGQCMLLALAERVRAAAATAARVEDDEIGAVVPRWALLCARHESQYSRLFRS